VGQGAGEYGSAAGGGGLGFTARIRVGRFLFEVGSPAGTRADLSPDPPTGTGELRAALAEAEPTGGLAQAEHELGGAESATGRVERALELFTAVAQGRILEQDVLRRETDSLLGALERADREGRYEDAIRLARVLSRLLALTGRWVALVGTLRVALRSAAALGDAPGIAWSRHELGTLSLAAEDAEAANGQLTEALRLRRELGDPAEVEVTEHNLGVAKAAFRSGPSGTTIAVIVAAILLVVAAGVAIALTRGGDDEPDADTKAPTVEITSGPEETTEETSATFAFEADEPVERFECRLDDGAFEECVSPFSTPGTLAPGEHVFVVRATDPAGNRSDPAEYGWTVEPGRGPTVAITDGPNALTNQTRAEFAVDPGDAVTLECRLDDQPFATCPTLPAYDVEEGDHVFTVRGRDAAGTAGPPAKRAWTVDTTPPAVEITDSQIGETTATIAFTPSEDVRTLRCTLTTDAEVEPPPEPACASPVVYEGLADGTPWVFEVVATDLAGNVGRPARLEFETEPIVE
jgi:hypothetical protein